MTIGPTDGNLYALAQHQDEIERHADPEEGARCPCCEDGTVELEEPENCYCRLSAPCGAHEVCGLICDTCGETWQ